ncbi:MAG: zinc-ribbon domain-containing protein [Nanoarchaeota archaeon]|nr:zinc-ribbon domain-containing protein [Nanoarchaeota archaeon]
MPCPHCGAKIEKKWTFCSACGVSLVQQDERFSDIFDTNLSHVFQQINEMAKRMQQEFDQNRNIQVLDLTPFFRNAKASGFTINIHQHGGRKPQVEVKTFGDVKPRAIEKQVEQYTGTKLKTRPEKEDMRFAKAKQTREPSANVRRVGNRIAVDVELPGVKETDIQINELESSVEVKALAGDTMYFRIFTKPNNTSLLEKRFHDGKLHLLFA